ncbi:MAG: hypothetical protein ACW960_01525 [Candidatus Thorarchaeota archaeon]
MVAITVKDDVEVFPTTEYILLEISPIAGRVDIPKISNTIRDLVKSDKRMVAIRGYGFKGVGLSVRVAHELKKRPSIRSRLQTLKQIDPSQVSRLS